MSNTYSSLFFIFCFQEEKDGEYYVGGLCPINDTISQGEDLGKFLMSELQKAQMSKKT